MVVYAAQGDHVRSIELLFRGSALPEKRTAPGPKPALTIDAIAKAAIAIADTRGIAGLSMHAVGDKLGRTAMALYTYIPSKTILGDLIYDHAHAELTHDYPLDQGWRAAVTSWARNLWEFYLRHPWTLQISQSRPVLGPHECALVEALARILNQTHLETRVLRHAISTLVAMIRGMAQTVAEARQALMATGTSEQDWWFARSAAIQESVADFSERFPLITRLQQEDAPANMSDSTLFVEKQVRSAFEGALALVLDGIESALQRSEAAKPEPSSARAVVRPIPRTARA